MVLINRLTAILNLLYKRFGKRVVWSIGALIILLIGAGVFLNIRGNTNDLETNGQLRTVAVARVSTLSRESSLSLIGEVEAINQAAVASEVSGRIVWVPVSLGSYVAAGQVIAQFENSRERAGVLQAEGAYEATLANTSEAETDGENVYREAYIIANNTIRGIVDELFILPYSDRPRFLISKTRFTSYIEDERIVIGKILKDWEFSVFSDHAKQVDTLTLLEEAEENTDQIIEYVSRVVEAIARQAADERFSESDLTLYRSRLFTAQTSLNATLANVQDARGDLLTAIVGNGNVSAAFAAVKQALGSLRLAQSALEKTIIRAPVSGTINTLDVKVGDFVSVQKRVALVANNSGLEITTFVGEEDRAAIAVGDEVIIDKTIPGRITQIAPALHPDTKKIEVRISTKSEDLNNGDTVRIEIFADASSNVITAETAIHIPLTAVKLTADSAYVFTVSPSNILVGNKVILGRANGQRVEIESGLTPEMEIVVDARGLNEGIRVNVE